ncbi:Piso0_005921 [Millerozyma farinosa CBS 7064]|uniref:Piso0_005921 protein n=1 Tax=Pichia sorbitophila (strain ATCC MYA-4447 / BCRC 22081 / CBS 7064 / NBRC 10061 / NRRL Y-12695) TaxID=559304 RepID=G8Y393_PICSO|nr:Piso0_005921 [Millerozyma farinosa CBS 7064]
MGADTITGIMMDVPTHQTTNSHMYAHLVPVVTSLHFSYGLRISGGFRKKLYLISLSLIWNIWTLNERTCYSLVGWTLKISTLSDRNMEKSACDITIYSQMTLLLELT